MNTLSTIYTLGLVAIYLTMGGEFTFWVILVSAMIAAIPFTTTILFFLLPIGILIWSFWITNSTVYGSNFAWLCIIYAPFYYVSWLSIILNVVKGVFGHD